MCFHSKQSLSAKEIEKRFKAKFENIDEFESSVYNGFQFPKTPIIANNQPGKIQMFNWGLIPFWAKDDSIRKNTLNARIETIHEKPSFRNVTKNRCLILADGFFEWQWLDDKGKTKQKYEVSLPDHEPFTFAGLWSEWVDQSTGEVVNSYTILTTEANELMSRIHNTKKRMPVILSSDFEKEWLLGQDLVTGNDRLIGTIV